ncbi:MAG TPA: 50S ribosomal protein L14 [Candidatus Nanoarchaeia archaeon]|nr:50S ribosomal protein L14P, large subunit ribosomal protein L14 [uncultured archaeon]HJX05451.1 50S ribosomal protein L14 [Candidatus Nanoarchaeia archaeon]
MKAVKAHITAGLQKGSYLETCDNSGAKLLKIISFKRSKTVKGRNPQGGIGDLITASVVKGRPDMRKQVVFAIIVRQRREYMRRNGVRIKFEDNSAIVLKDDKGTPKGTIFKGPIAKEVTERWPAIAKVASMVI